LHGVWDAMDLAGNAEDCALPPENYKPCNLASALLRLGHGLSPRILRHATSPPLRFGSVTGCRPIKSKIPTISCVSKLPPKWREFYFLHVPSSKPCNLVSKAHSVTGCRPIKKLKNKFSYVSELPTKFVFTFFAWLVVFVKKVLALWKKVW
jgi:hypothetical protein